MKIYKAELLSKCEIIDTELIRETSAFVTVIYRDGYERKEKRETSHHKFFYTFYEAKEWLMTKLDLKISDHQRQIDQLKSKKQKVNNL